MTQRNLSVRLALEGGQQVKRELQEVGQTGQRALARVRDASQPASKGLLAVDAASREVQASLGRFAAQLGPVGRGLTALGPAGLAAGAAIGGIVLALRQGFEAAAEAEQRMFRLEGVLRATGHASGLTARELEQFAIGLDRSTLAAKNDVLEAAGALATFRSISGETFKDTLRLAQDLAAVFGGDLRGQAQLLGRALEDPTQGLSALRRVGVSFTQSQREAIAAMAEAGDVASAQRAILAELERQVGGAGAAEAQGLKGAVDGLSLAWRLMLEEIGKTPAVTGLASGAIDLVRRSVEGWTRILGGGPIAEQIVAVNRELLEAEARLDRLRASGSDRLLHAQELRVQRLRQELDALLAQANAEAESFAEEQREAEAGQRAAAAERIAEVVAGIERKLQQQLYELTVDRIQKVRDEEAKSIRELEELRAQGGDPARIERLIAERRELARRQVEDTLRPAREAEARRAEAAREQAAARVAANERIVQSLARELELITSLHGVERERARFVEQAVGRLADPTPARVREVERLAAALFDEARAQEESARARDQQARILDGITQQWRALNNAQDGAVAALERWRAETLASLDAAAEGYETFARQVEAIFQARLPADGKLIFDASGTGWLSKGVVARFYPGSENQLPDPLLQAELGAANTPAHRGLVYLVLEDLALADFGNRIPMITAEIAWSAAALHPQVSLPGGGTDSFTIDHHRGLAWSVASGRLDRYDLWTNQRTATLDLGSNQLPPRADPEGRVYLQPGVSNSNPVYQIDPHSCQVAASMGSSSTNLSYGTNLPISAAIAFVDFPEWNEKLLVLGGFLNPGRLGIYNRDSLQFRVADNNGLGSRIRHLMVDRQRRIWALGLSTGGTTTLLGCYRLTLATGIDGPLFALEKQVWNLTTLAGIEQAAFAFYHSGDESIVILSSASNRLWKMAPPATPTASGMPPSPRASPCRPG